METHAGIRRILILIPFALIGIFLVYPVISVIFLGLTQGPGSSFLEVMQSSVTQRVFSFTITQSIISTVLALLIGLPGAMLLSRIRFPGKKIIRALLIIPFILPPIVVVVGFLQVFGSGGIIDTILMTILGISDSVFNLASGFSGIVLAHAFYNIPLFLLMVSASLERLNPEIEEVAEILGASSIAKFRRIILPHIRTSLAAASILTFLFCFMSFPIVLALGEGSFVTLEVQIWNAFRFFDYGEAASLALVQLIVTISLAYFYNKSNKDEGQPSGKVGFIRTVKFTSFPYHQRALIISYASILIILVLGPMVAIVRSAVYDPFAQEYTLRGFAYLIDPAGNGGFIPLVNSIVYAGLATLFSILIGLILVLSRNKNVSQRLDFASMITLLPLGISAITIAYGLLIAIAVPLGWSTNPWPLIVIAQTLLGVPFSYRAIEIAKSKIDSEILEQAESLGAGLLHRIFYIELPLLAPGLLVAGFFSFALAIGEMSATIFLARPENITLAIAIYRNLTIRRFVEAGAASLFLVVICIIAFVTMEKLSEEGYGGTL